MRKMRTRIPRLPTTKAPSKAKILHREAEVGFPVAHSIQFPLQFLRMYGLHEPNVSASSVAPYMHERIGCAQLVARCEEEEGSARAVGDMKFSKCLLHRMRTVLVGRDRKDTEGLPAESLIVRLRCMRTEICLHLALEARLQKVSANDRHSAAIDLDHEDYDGNHREVRDRTQDREHRLPAGVPGVEFLPVGQMDCRY
jgi:hypothetical protein